MDKYRVKEGFELIIFSQALVEYFNLRYLYEVQLRQKSRYLCSIGVRRGPHQGAIRLMLIGRSLQVLTRVEPIIWRYPCFLHTIFSKNPLKKP